MYKRALQRHPAPRWEQFVVEAGRVDRMPRVAAGEEPDEHGSQLERLLLAVADAKAQCACSAG